MQLLKKLNSPLICLSCVLLTWLTFALIYLISYGSFRMSSPEKSPLFISAKNKFFTNICNESRSFTTTISKDGCAFELKQDAAMYIMKKIKSVSLSYYGFTDEKINLKYITKYDCEDSLDMRNKSVGLIKFGEREHGAPEHTLLMQIIPFIELENHLVKEEPEQRFEEGNGCGFGPRLASADIISLGLFKFKLAGKSYMYGHEWQKDLISDEKDNIEEFKRFLNGELVFISGWEKFVTFLYFSGITLTTIGYGDITAMTQEMRILTILEGILGIFFMGVLCASFFNFISSKPENK